MAAAAVTSMGWHCAVKNVAVASTSGVAERNAEASFGRSAFRGDAVSGFLKQGNKVFDSSRSGTSRQQSVFKRAPISSVITEVAKKTVPVDEAPRADPKTVVSLILGGGAGTRLFPLTKRRAKPAVPIGGGYRLIDVPMSNCINSGINKVFILTQFNSASLNRHLARTYNFGNGINFGDGFVEVCYSPSRNFCKGQLVGSVVRAAFASHLCVRHLRLFIPSIASKGCKLANHRGPGLRFSTKRKSDPSKYCMLHVNVSTK